jgi:hypothetical protein
LSTRSHRGRPQRANARRSRSRTAAGRTSAHGPWGENRGGQHRAAALIDQAQPTHLATAAQADALSGIDLPDLVGLACPLVGRRAAAGAAGGGRGQALVGQPAPQRAGRGQAPAGVAVPEHEPDQVGAPAGVLAAQVGGGLHQVGRRGGLGAAAAAVVRGHAVGAVGGEAPAEAADGPGIQVQGGGDGRRPLALLPAAEQGTAQGDR